MSNELKHFGVLGMRWGRRNARSPSNYSPEHIKSRQISKKKVSEMSNEELKILNTRRQLERQYAQGSAVCPALSKHMSQFYTFPHCLPPLPVFRFFSRK